MGAAIEMPGWLSGILVMLVPGLAIAVATSWVTVQLSLRQFRRQRLWERRLEAYLSLMEALHRIKKYCGAMERSLTNAGEYNPSDADKQKTNEALAELAKATDLGSLLLSDRAAACLMELEDHADLRTGPTVSDWYDFFANANMAVTTCLDQLRAIAKDDLKKSRD